MGSDQITDLLAQSQDHASGAAGCPGRARQSGFGTWWCRTGRGDTGTASGPRVVLSEAGALSLHGLHFSASRERGRVGGPGSKSIYTNLAYFRGSLTITVASDSTF